MKRGKLLLLLCLIFSSIVYSQDTSRNAQMKILENVIKKYNDLVKIGLSSDDVILKLGEPEEVNPGIPENPERLFLYSIPYYHKQRLFTTWVYHKDTIKVHLSGTGYYLNERHVSKDIYDEYLKKNVMYLRKNSIIYPANINIYHDLGIRVDSSVINSRKVKPIDFKDDIITLVYVVFNEKDSTVKSVFVTFLPLEFKDLKQQRK